MEKGSLNTMEWDDKEAQGVVQIGGVRLPLMGTGRIYICGITPYDTTHLGHAATFVWADMAARVLHLTGHPVEVCRNITDVDDHLLIQAKEQDVPWKSLATQQSYRFEHDMDLLGISRPAFEPRSHDHVDGVIALAIELLVRGVAYERNGSVYFRGGEVHQTAGLSRERGDIAGGRTRRPPRRPEQGRFARCRVMDALDRRRAGLAEPVGSGAAGLARGVHGHGPHDLRCHGGPARRGRRSGVPAPRL